MEIRLFIRRKGGDKNRKEEKVENKKGIRDEKYY